MMNDARISVGLPSHPKTKKLIKKAGTDAAWRLVCLFLWVAQNKPNGDFCDMSAEDIEIAVDWDGEEGAFVKALVDVGFVDGNDEDGYSIHDWEEHNPWAAGAEKRSEKARFNALCKHVGREEAARRMPEYAASKQAACNKSATSMHVAETSSATSMLESSAPSPSPSPSPSPKDKDIPPDGGDDLKAELFSYAKAIGIKASMVGKAIKEIGEIEAMAALQQSDGQESPVNAFAASVRNRKVKIEVAGESAEMLKPKLFDPAVLSI